MNFLIVQFSSATDCTYGFDMLLRRNNDSSLKYREHIFVMEPQCFLWGRDVIFKELLIYVSGSRVLIKHWQKVMLKTGIEVCRIEKNYLVNSLVFVSVMQSFIIILPPLSFRLSFSFCLHGPSTLCTKVYRMSPALVSSRVINFIDVIIDAWRRQWPHLRVSRGTTGPHGLRHSIPRERERGIINLCWPVKWPRLHYIVSSI
jgi:hypothetical protein